jgi:hypothetical protein
MRRLIISPDGTSCLIISLEKNEVPHYFFEKKSRFFSEEILRRLIFSEEIMRRFIFF